MNQKIVGLHIIADLYKCDFSTLNTIKLNDLKKSVSSKIHQAGLHEMGKFYKCWGLGAFSAVISLAESHLTFHSWPELGYVSLDIFVCNYQNDNTDKAMFLYKSILDIFKPGDIKEQIIQR